MPSTCARRADRSNRPSHRSRRKARTRCSRSGPQQSTQRSTQHSIQPYTRAHTRAHTAVPAFNLAFELRAKHLKGSRRSRSGLNLMLQLPSIVGAVAVGAAAVDRGGGLRRRVAVAVGALRPGPRRAPRRRRCGRPAARACGAGGPPALPPPPPPEREREKERSVIGRWAALAGRQPRQRCIRPESGGAADSCIPSSGRGRGIAVTHQRGGGPRRGGSFAVSCRQGAVLQREERGGAAASAVERSSATQTLGV